MQSSFGMLVSFELANHTACLLEIDMWCKKHFYQRTKLVLAIMREGGEWGGGGFNVETETWYCLITCHMATKLHVTRSD